MRQLASEKPVETTFRPWANIAAKRHAHALNETRRVVKVGTRT